MKNQSRPAQPPSGEAAAPEKSRSTSGHRYPTDARLPEQNQIILKRFERKINHNLDVKNMDQNEKAFNRSILNKYNGP